MWVEEEASCCGGCGALDIDLSIDLFILGSKKPWLLVGGGPARSFFCANHCTPVHHGASAVIVTKGYSNYNAKAHWN